MGDFLTYKHSFNAGDLITALPGIQKLYKEKGKKAIIYQRLDFPANYDHKYPHPIKSESGQQVSMNNNSFLLMKPLLEFQDYIERFEIWDGQDVDFDIEATRINNPSIMTTGQIHYWPVLEIPQLASNLSERWIGADSVENNFICINFTQRYRNPFVHYIFLSKYEKEIRFIGLKHEHELFCNRWGLDFPYIEVSNFLELAQIINGCRFFIGNQSFCWHIADAIKKHRLLEVCMEFPNTFPTGANGYPFIKQEGLEYYFDKLLKETNEIKITNRNSGYY